MAPPLKILALTPGHDRHECGGAGIVRGAGLEEAAVEVQIGDLRGAVAAVGERVNREEAAIEIDIGGADRAALSGQEGEVAIDDKSAASADGYRAAGSDTAAMADREAGSRNAGGASDEHCAGTYKVVGVAPVVAGCMGIVPVELIIAWS